MNSRLLLYNTATRKKEPIPNGKLGIYVCGVTPYDTTHLGHAFTFISYDVLVRYLRFLGKQVTYVQNVTDIDDDILLRAKKVRMNWRQLADRETNKYLEDMDVLHWTRPDYYVRATDHITTMIRIIVVLIKNGYAYESNGNVYFSVKKDKCFGQHFCTLSYDAMLDIANERGNYPKDPNKKDPLDFVLWQSSKRGEPFWESPWGKGRPGWHIECSAMSIKYLGQPFWLHGGGADLKFPHHESEISQSENAFGKPFAKHWMHVAMVYCGKRKMSKSLGNMVFVRDLLKRYSPNVIRWYLLSHHYREEWNYSERELKAVIPFVEELETIKSTKSEHEIKKQLNYEDDFFKALNDDLDTPKALEILGRHTLKDSEAAQQLAREVLGFKL